MNVTIHEDILRDYIHDALKFRALDAKGVMEDWPKATDAFTEYQMKCGMETLLDVANLIIEDCIFYREDDYSNFAEADIYNYGEPITEENAFWAST